MTVDANYVGPTVPAGGFSGFYATANDGGASQLIDVSAGFLGGLVEGCKVWVDSFRDSFTWYPSRTDTADNVTVVAPTAVGVGPGRFIRDCIASPTWTVQATWYVDPTNAGANDEHEGSAGASPLKTWNELRRRIGKHLIQQDTTIHIVSDMPATDRFTMDLGSVNTATVTIVGTRVVLLADQVMDNYANRNTAAVPATANQLTCNAIASWVPYTPATDGGILVVPTTGPAVGTAAYVAEDLGANVAQMSSFYDAAGMLEVQPVANNHFNIERCPRILSYQVNPSGGTWYFQNLYFNQFGADRAGGTTWSTSGIEWSNPTLLGIQWQNCSFEFLSPTMSGAQFWNCLWIDLGHVVYNCTIQWAAGMWYGADYLGSTPTYSTFYGSVVIGSSGMLFKEVQCVCYQNSWFDAYDVGVFQSIGDSVVVAYSSSMYIVNLWGGTAAGYGMKVKAGCQVQYANKPSINSGLGAGRETIVGGTDTLWANIPYVETTNLAAIVLYA